MRNWSLALLLGVGTAALLMLVKATAGRIVLPNNELYVVIPAWNSALNAVIELLLAVAPGFVAGLTVKASAASVGAAVGLLILPLGWVMMAVAWGWHSDLLNAPLYVLIVVPAFALTNMIGSIAGRHVSHHGSV